MSATTALGWLFACATLGAFLILCAIALHAVPRILATLAIITTLAAIAAAIPQGPP
ncbi:hypothetical protein [Streptomyces sp. NPDC048565]|uniref:hypothetical protein n=1 Tax=Streptomyces sp. NPDC048565 TaxID=3155266 RepID=UPI00343FC80B